MLRGGFAATSGHPYLWGRVRLPRRRLAANVRFLVDTGADSCLLMPSDARILGVDLAALGLPRVAKIGVGGEVFVHDEPALLAFYDEGGKLRVYRRVILIAPDNPALSGVPSLLGRDILRSWRMVYHPRAGRLDFDVIESDETIEAGTWPA
jgi:hypothetical protein